MVRMASFAGKEGILAGKLRRYHKLAKVRDLNACRGLAPRPGSSTGFHCQRRRSMDSRAARAVIPLAPAPAQAPSLTDALELRH